MQIYKRYIKNTSGYKQGIQWEIVNDKYSKKDSL